MNQPIDPKVKAASHHRLAMESKETLRRMQEDFPAAPAAMRYFYELHEQKYVRQEVAPSQKPKIGTLCVQVPEELIMAAGAIPERLCNGSYAMDQLGAEFMPARSCSLVKASLGQLSLDKENPQHALLAMPTTCDQKKKSAALLSMMGHRPYLMEMPPSKDSHQAREYWAASVEDFARTLERTLKTKITKQGLKEAVALTNQARREFRRFFALRQEKPSLIYGKDAFLVTHAYFFDDLAFWTQALAQLNSELEARRDQGESIGSKRAPRILYTGSPVIFPNLKTPLLIEEAGAIVVTDEVCSSNRLLYDSPILGEGSKEELMGSLADRYLKPCTCPCYVPNDDRKRKLAEMITKYQVDGVIYQALSGCQLYEMEHKPVEHHLAQLGVPMLYLESDYSTEDQGQLATRIEAFLEGIHHKKRSEK